MPSPLHGSGKTHDPIWNSHFDELIDRPQPDPLAETAAGHGGQSNTGLLVDLVGGSRKSGQVVMSSAPNINAWTSGHLHRRSNY